MFLFLLAVTCGLTVLVSSYPSGAPLEACENFEAHHNATPTHDRYHQPQNTPPPYDITINPANVAPGGEVTVTIKGDTFKGFLIQGNDAITKKIVGSFVIIDPSKSKTLNCPGGDPGNSATHAESSSKISIELLWQAPLDYSGRVTFKATVLKSYDTFWYGITSPVLTVG